MKVVGIAEPREMRRKMFAEKYSLTDDFVFTSWEEVTIREKFADAVVIATLDDLHKAPCIAFANLGYHILCEKPMACTEIECIEMVEASRKNNIILAFGHVMRYTNEYMTVKKLIDEGEIGEIVGIQHMEPVGWWHFAHSYVRGNWKKEIKDCGSLMAKSCHDLDLIKHFLGDKKCLKIQSFGSLSYFKLDNKPKDASDRCLDCKIEKTCPYSAVRQYIKPVESGIPDYFTKVVCDVPDIENITEALRTGPYGKCVYTSDNDVCDHQTVSMEFEDGKYVTFTMSAFTRSVCTRKIKILGTMGEIDCDGHKFVLSDFRTEKIATFTPSRPKQMTTMSGHGFADFYLMKNFVQAVALNDPTIISSGPEDSLRGHRLVFAAERSRKLGGKMMEVNI